ncbi:MAG: type II toxin-antitoxin system VapC family toxin [Candidatus Rokubacteria bacterium]|nr:type II toxin-antitoxin system VapC family toxin [Candidatus Rokubacteria bacterium]
MPAGKPRPGYFDTSVLTKCYVEEPGSDAALAAFTRYVVVSCAIAPVELASALRRRRDAGDLSESGLAAIDARIRDDRAQWELRAVDRVVLERAEGITRSFAVRTLDALHLASAVAVRDESGHALPFVTGDARQRHAAVALGLDVVFVE